MRVELVKEFAFEARQRLPRMAGGDECSRLRSHTFRVAVTADGEVDLRTQSGSLIDYEAIQRAMKPLLDHLDHADLNEIEGLENPTSENISRWIWDRLKDRLPGLKGVSLRHTCTAGRD